jgi:hypothetical protein
MMISMMIRAPLPRAGLCATTDGAAQGAIN